MAWEVPTLTGRQSSALALGLALVGLALIYFWPLQSEYQQISPGQVALLSDGKWVELSGQVESRSDKSAGYSLRVCDWAGGCATVSVSEAAARALQSDGLPPPIGANLTVQGEVAVVQGNPFVRAHRVRWG